MRIDDDFKPGATKLLQRHASARLRCAAELEGTARRDASSVLRAASLNAAQLTPFAAGQERRVQGAAAGPFAIAMAEFYLFVASLNARQEHVAIQHTRGVLDADERIARERQRLLLERAERAVRNASMIDLAADLEIPVIG